MCLNGEDGFRLRKKIETNPNKPEYIITVKGRGFKLGE
jgi:DNA-binding response OmpR family regulator